jgi:hypothetical protein
MRLQIASVLPAPKVEQSALQTKGVFGATLSAAMLGTHDSTKADPRATGAWPSKLAPLDTNFGADESNGPIEKPIGQAQLSAEEAQAGSSLPRFSYQHVTEQHEQKGPAVPQLGSEGAAVTKEPRVNPVAEDSIIERSGAQSVVQQKKTQVATRQKDLTRQDLSRQPSAAAATHLTASIMDASPHTSHKPETMHDEVHVAADQSYGMALSDLVLPAATLQPGGSQPVSAQPPSEAVTSHVWGRNSSGRTPVQTMDTSQAAASGTSFPTLRSQPLLLSSSTLAAQDGESFHPSMTSGHLSGAQSDPLSKQKSGANAIALSPPPLQSNATHSIPGSDKGTALQMNARILKETQGTTETEPKSEVKVSVPTHPTLGSAAVEHSPVPNFSPIPHGTEKGIATHRPEASPAQMLQKMDMAASPGVMQLRADARRLDVGVSSSTLGWVEVRATTGPSGRIDATLQTQNDASAHVLASQSSEIASYAREHSVQLGQVSVGVATGDNRQDQSRHAAGRDQSGVPTRGSVQSQANTEQAHHAGEAVSLINVRV